MHPNEGALFTATPIVRSERIRIIFRVCFVYFEGLPGMTELEGLDRRAPSPRARFPAPITAKAGPMPTHQRFRLDNRHDLQDRGKPAIDRKSTRLNSSHANI